MYTTTPGLTASQAPNFVTIFSDQLGTVLFLLFGQYASTLYAAG